MPLLRFARITIPALLAVLWNQGHAQSPPLQIIATTGMIADTLRQVGGEHVAVKGLMGPGVDPHLYRQTRNDISAMTQADAVFWNGLDLEAQLHEFLERLAQRKPVFAVGEAVPEERRRADEEYTDRWDPHIWMDPGRWRYVVEASRDALIELNPGASDAFRANADAFLIQLQALDDYARETLASVPASAQVLVTAHDAFGYLGDAYGYEVEGIQGFSTESEAGLARIEQLVDLLVERQIGAIFVESSVPERNIRALVEGAAAQGWAVEIGGELYSDAMGAPGTYEGTYIGMIDHNVTTIARALGGDVPPGGMNDELSTSREDSQ
ncbi:manganese transporter [Litchfieldella qijiaojingensis]|uniref:Manganese transporter n=1 Tax=Litchfieldella qijiaojingensis TaxID=980347 RepID=A0ABQ2YXT6_9GAMM|nr:zinc ABC transporter substrate-binding protein [Halomonas qijiaojingensis]GGX96565.1 manganese transporter [Halomonas qijiaojingensis]